jgi:hypothetical protein
MPAGEAASGGLAVNLAKKDDARKRQLLPETDLCMSAAMKTLLCFMLCVAGLAAADVKILKDTKLVLLNGLVTLKAGTVVQLVSNDGETLAVTFRNMAGTIPTKDSDQKPSSPVAQREASKDKPAPAAKTAAKPAAPQTAAKPAPAPAAAGPREPTTNYGKMVQKAKESEAKHTEKVVSPVDDILK